MSNITIVTKIRFLAAIAPLVLAVVSPLAALAFSAFGSLPAAMNEEEIAALRDAQGLDNALYKMEWGRTQPNGLQIVLDQQRRFADLSDSATRHVYTAEQRDMVEALAQASKPILDDFRSANPHDEAMNARMRDLHTMITELQNADDSALATAAESSSIQAREFRVLILIAGLGVPIVCLALIWRLTGTAWTALHSMRDHLERISERPAARDAAMAADLEAVGEALTGLGFPKPDPMLA